MIADSPYLLSSAWVVPSIAVLIAVLLLCAQRMLRRYINMIVSLVDEQGLKFDASGSASDDTAAGEEVSFLADDGHALAGAVYAARNDVAHRGVVLFLHAFGSDRRGCVPYREPLRQAGYDVFSFDFRGHGASKSESGYRPRAWPSDRERSDVRGAISFAESWLERRDGSRSIVLFGLSRGAGAAILASVGQPSVRAIVAEGVFCTNTTFEYVIRRFATIFVRVRLIAENYPPIFWRFFCSWFIRVYSRQLGCRYPSVRSAMRRLRSTPVLLIHGERDSYVRVPHSQGLYDRAPGSKDLWVVPGASHNQGLDRRPDEYVRRVLGFLDEHDPVCAPNRCA